jgi:hypothetical protein
MSKKKQQKKPELPENGAIPKSLIETWEALRSLPPIPAGRLASMLGLTHGRPWQLVNDDKIATSRPGPKYGPELILEYVCWLRERAEARDTGARGQIEQEKLRALKRENDLAEKRVAPVEVLGEALEKGVALIASAHDRLPHELKRRWPEITGDQLALVKRVIADCQNAMAELELDL